MEFIVAIKGEIAIVDIRGLYGKIKNHAPNEHVARGFATLFR